MTRRRSIAELALGELRPLAGRPGCRRGRVLGVGAARGEVHVGSESKAACAAQCLAPGKGYFIDGSALDRLHLKTHWKIIRGDEQQLHQRFGYARGGSARRTTTLERARPRLEPRQIGWCPTPVDCPSVRLNSQQNDRPLHYPAFFSQLLFSRLNSAQ